MLLHGLTQGLLAGIGGGGALAGVQGAAGAVVAAGLGPTIAKAAQQMVSDAGLQGAAGMGVGNLLSQLVTSGLAALVGGGAGAATAASVEIDNYLSHAQVDAMLAELRDRQASQTCDESDILKKYADLSGAQDAALQACSDFDCIASHLADAASEKATLATDMQALKEAGCVGCAAMLSSNNTDALTRSAFIAGWCVESPGPTCAADAKQRLLLDDLALGAANVALAEMGGRVVVKLAQAMGASLADAFSAVFKRAPTASEVAALEADAATGGGTALRPPPAAGDQVSHYWDLPPVQRGRLIEKDIIATDYPNAEPLPSNFPVIDVFENGTAVSIKSLDLRAATYQDANNLASTLRGYIDDVAQYAGTGGKTIGPIRIDATDIIGRGLDLAVPNAGNPVQQAMIEQMLLHARSVGVNVRVLVK